MKRPLAAALALAAAGLAHAESGGNVGLMLGYRGMQDEVAWDRLEDQFAFGLQAAFAAADSALGGEAGFLLSVGSTDVGGVQVTASIVELFAGLRFQPPTAARARPFLGAGITGLATEMEGDGGGVIVSDDDSTTGYYLHGGLLFGLGRHGFIGFDARVVGGTEIELFGLRGDADYRQFTVTGGYAWGAQAARRAPRAGRR